MQAIVCNHLLRKIQQQPTRIMLSRDAIGMKIMCVWNIALMSAIVVMRTGIASTVAPTIRWMMKGSVNWRVYGWMDLLLSILSWMGWGSKISSSFSSLLITSGSTSITAKNIHGLLITSSTWLGWSKARNKKSLIQKSSPSSRKKFYQHSLTTTHMPMRSINEQKVRIVFSLEVHWSTSSWWCHILSFCS